MTLDLKKPKYVIPVILLPFVCLLFYSYQISFGRQHATKRESKDSLQSSVGGVSQQIRSQILPDKLDVLRQTYGQSAGYTAIKPVGGDALVSSPETLPLYNENEKRVLDSIAGVVDSRYGYDRNPRSYAVSKAGFPTTTAIAEPGSYTDQDRALTALLARIKQPANDRNQPKNAKVVDPMQLFRQQMAIIDSMSKATDHEAQETVKKTKQHRPDPKPTAEGPRPLTVGKAPAALSVFNTVWTVQPQSPITAVVDQDVTAYAGSRLRIRLLEDIWAGHICITAGTFLYAHVTGFSGQRVNLSVTSVLLNGYILPLKLDLYDTDGLPGLYIPESAFRDFTRELGADATGLSLEEQSGDDNQQVRSLLGKMFQSTTAAVSKLIRQNKAKLKYQTLIYLIDPAEMHNPVQNR